MVKKSSDLNTKKRFEIYKKVNASDIGKKSFSLRVSDTLIPIIIFCVVLFSGFYILNQKYQKKIYVSQLKLSTSIIEQGLKNVIANQGEDDITRSNLWEYCNIKNLDDNIDKCENELKKYYIGIKIIKSSDEENGLITDKEICKQSVGKYNKWWNLNSNSECSGWNNLTFSFNNGIKADALIIGTNKSYIVGQLTLDVNGAQKPNRWGRDTFLFNILKDGSLIAYSGYTDCKILAEYLNESLDYVLKQRHWEYANTCSSSTTSDGTACAARVIENNWEMDY